VWIVDLEPPVQFADGVNGKVAGGSPHPDGAHASGAARGNAHIGVLDDDAPVGRYVE
jgi:hypothetical protein